MSSDLFLFDSPIFSDPLTIPAVDDLRPIDPFEILPEFQENGGGFYHVQENEDPAPYFDLKAVSLHSSSPDPSVHFRNLSIDISHFRNAESSGEPEGFPISFEPFSVHEKPFMPQSCSLEDGQIFPTYHRFGSLVDPRFFNNQTNQSLHLRRVYSAGDLPKTKTNYAFTEEANYKARRYSAEEKRERIGRYRAKRAQRNFNKTIKYACRKTLADNRQRVRGRFARNEEAGETPKASSFHAFDDDFWIDGFGGDGENEITRSQKMCFGYHLTSTQW